MRIPIAHGEGRYIADEATLNELRAGNRVLVRYCDERGETTPAANPNGSIDNIAGVANETFNVFGLMPHPERAAERLLGSADGRVILDSIVRALRAAA